MYNIFNGDDGGEVNDDEVIMVVVMEKLVIK
jgi:hypothetical protein